MVHVTRAFRATATINVCEYGLLSIRCWRLFAEKNVTTLTVHPAPVSSETDASADRTDVRTELARLLSLSLLLLLLGTTQG